MNVVTLAWRYLWSRPLAALLNLGLMSLGLACVTFLLLVGAQIERAFQRDLAGIDLVVGAKGSPIQLILAGVFHIDVPPGNIRLADLQELAKHPQVAQVIPLSLGDSYQGYRVVGTSADYLAHYGAKLSQGRVWDGELQAVLGADVARSSGLALGEKFSGSHGLGGGGGEHGETPYQVVGHLAACNCVLDRLILTGTESVWAVHEKGGGATGKDRALADDAHEVTLALVRYKTPLAAVTLPRHVNTSTSMQAAAPAIEVTRLLHMLGVGSTVLQAFAAVLLLIAGLSVFMALWNAVRERQGDLAMLRMLGAGPGRIAGLVLCEAFCLVALACLIGLPIGHLLAALLGLALEAQRSLHISGWIWVQGELLVLALAWLLALLAASFPAVLAYRVDVAQLLESR